MTNIPNVVCLCIQAGSKHSSVYANTTVPLSLHFPKCISEGDTKHEHVSVGIETQFVNHAYTLHAMKIRGYSIVNNHNNLTSVSSISCERPTVKGEITQR
jgi:hypothetical protein